MNGAQQKIAPESSLVALVSSLAEKEVRLHCIKDAHFSIVAHDNDLEIHTNNTSKDALRAATAVGIGMLLDDEQWAKKGYESTPKKYQHAVPPCWSALAHLHAVELATSRHPVLASRIRRAQARYGLGKLDTSQLPVKAGNILQYVIEPHGEAKNLISQTEKNTIDAMRGKDWDKQLKALSTLVGKHIPPHRPPRRLAYAPLQEDTNNSDNTGQANVGNNGKANEVSRYITPSAHYLLSRKNIRTTTEDIVSHGSPRWEYHRPYGRIDLKKVVTPLIDYTTSFKTITYSDVMTRNIFVLVDASASTRDIIEETIQVSWALQGWQLGNVTTYVFSDTTHIWEKHTESAVAVPKASGGTNLHSGIKNLTGLPGEGDIVVICTDGDVPQEYLTTVEDEIKELQKTATVVSWKKPLGSATIVYTVDEILKI